MKIGWSDFAVKRHVEGNGQSYFNISKEQIINLIEENWDKRIPGSGETNVDRKVLVPVSPEGFLCPPRMPLQKGMPIIAEVITRQEGEDPFVEYYITVEDAKKFGFKGTPAKSCNIVCYSAEALQENGGERSTDCDWEIVAILATEDDVVEPMPPLTMARNYLEKSGGTKTDYSAQEFAESIYFHATNKGIKVKNKS